MLRFPPNKVMDMKDKKGVLSYMYNPPYMLKLRFYFIGNYLCRLL